MGWDGDKFKVKVILSLFNLGYIKHMHVKTNTEVPAQGERSKRPVNYKYHGYLGKPKTVIKGQHVNQVIQTAY